MFLSLALYRNNPRANSEPPKVWKSAPRVAHAGRLAADRSAKARKQKAAWENPRGFFVYGEGDVAALALMQFRDGCERRD